MIRWCIALLLFFSSYRWLSDEELEVFRRAVASRENKVYNGIKSSKVSNFLAELFWVGSCNERSLHITFKVLGLFIQSLAARLSQHCHSILSLCSHRVLTLTFCHKNAKMSFQIVNEIATLPPEYVCLHCDIPMTDWQHRTWTPDIVRF